MSDGNGFWRLFHNDLAAALSRSDLCWELARVYLALADLTLGYGKQKDTVSLSQIAEVAGMRRNNVARTLKQLKALGLCGQSKTRTQKVVRWVTWPPPAIKVDTAIGSDNTSGIKTDTNTGIKGGINVDTHQDTKKKEKKIDVLFSEFWNTKGNLSIIQSMTPQRKKQLDTRMREKLFADNWCAIIDKLSASTFCTGHNDRGWKADIDWVLKNSTNYAKVIEGKYDNTLGNNANPDKNQFATHPATDNDLARLEAEGAFT